MSEATVALAPNAMTTLEDTMERLGISEEEADQATKNNLVRLINAASAWIETITGRHFGKATYTDRYAGPGAQELVLREYPIRSVEYVKDAVTGGLIDPGTYDFSMSGDIGVLYRDMGWTFRGYPYGLANDYRLPAAIWRSNSPPVMSCRRTPRRMSPPTCPLTSSPLSGVLRSRNTPSS